MQGEDRRNGPCISCITLAVDQPSSVSCALVSETTSNASLTIPCLRLNFLLIFLAILCAARPLETTHVLNVQLTILNIYTCAPGVNTLDVPSPSVAYTPPPGLAQRWTIPSDGLRSAPASTRRSPLPHDARAMTGTRARARPLPIGAPSSRPMRSPAILPLQRV